MPASRLDSDTEFTANAPDKSSVRWFVCFLLFLATTINYMDRSVFSLIEPQLHLRFMGWIPGVDAKYQVQYHLNYGHVIEWFQIAYGVGFLFAGRVIDRLGTKTGYALAILIWGCASLSHSLVTSVLGFCIARVFLGLGESGNFPAAIKATTEWFPMRRACARDGAFQLRIERQLLHRADPDRGGHRALGMARGLPHHRLDGHLLVRDLDHVPVQPPAPQLDDHAAGARSGRAEGPCMAHAADAIAGSTRLRSARALRIRSGGFICSICRCFCTTTTAWI